MNPTHRPVYDHPPAKGNDGRRIRLLPLLENLLFFAAMVATFILAIIVLREDTNLLGRLGYFLVFWAVLAYLALPRLHRILTSLYVPDYFIGRSRTGDGLLGDPINLAAVGSEEQLHTAMRRAGWVLADPVNLTSSARIITASLTRKSYAQAPVSPLFLFGRMQDFAYQQEVEGNPAQRHHVRFWRAPEGWLLPGGHRVDWLAGGTYDRSVGFSAFTLQVTHKIDRDIDVERDYIIDTVSYALPEARVEVLKDFSTGYHHRNGGGDAVQTDGNLPVLDVRHVHEEPALLPAAAPQDEDAMHRLGRRPVSVAAACLLSLGALITQATAMVVRSGQSGNDLAITAAAAGIAALLGIILLWRTYVGREWARLTLMLLIAVSLGAELSAAIGDTHLSVWSILSLAVDVLTIYALSSRSAREWTSPGSERSLA